MTLEHTTRRPSASTLAYELTTYRIEKYEEVFSPFSANQKNKKGARLTHHDFIDPEKLLSNYQHFVEDESISKEHDIELHPLLPSKNPEPFMPPINRPSANILATEGALPSTYRSATKSRALPSANKLPMLS